MEHARLGSTGLNVSRLALGCMSHGDNTSPNAHRWALDEEAAKPFFVQAVEMGITFWDTANVYQDGTSEELVGRAQLQANPEAGVDMACSLMTEIRASGAFDGVHLVPVGRYRTVAARLEHDGWVRRIT